MQILLSLIEIAIQMSKKKKKNPEKNSNIWRKKPTMINSRRIRVESNNLKACYFERKIPIEL